MKFHPISPIRYFYRYVFVLLFVGSPLYLAAFGNDFVVYEDRPAFIIFCIFLSAVGAVLTHIAFWEKFFAYLVLSEDEIRWKCLFRKTKVIPVSQCVEIGVYLENANNGIPTERIYFSALPDPQKTIGKNGVMKKSPQLITFWYSWQLCEYIIETYSEQQVAVLVEYRKMRRV